MTGYLAYSKAGHDRHKIYLIIREQGEYVYLADGKTKMPDHPKRKKKKHIQIIKKYARPETIQKLQRGEMVDQALLIQEVENVKSRCNRN